MRRVVLLTLLTTLCFAASAEARLFWQTYGSVASNVNGGTWNWNQDYFVPRHSDSCRYGLFSPCKTSCTTSPACKWCHPIHQGYCSPYGPCHYCWRNHVYQTYCGSSPLCVNGPYRANCCSLGFYGRHFCGKGCFRHGRSKTNCCESTGVCHNETCMPAAEMGYELPNVEPPAFEVLGSIPVDGDGLLANLDLKPLGDEADGRVFLGPQGLDLPRALPLLGNPIPGEGPQTLPTSE